MWKRLDDGKWKSSRWVPDGGVADSQTLMQRQDDTLGFISGTLTNLASQAGLIGNEVNEQGE